MLLRNNRNASFQFRSVQTGIILFIFVNIQMTTWYFVGYVDAVHSLSVCLHVCLHMSVCLSSFNYCIFFVFFCC